MSLWLMAAALERQTRSQEIRAVCAEAMQDPMGQANMQAHRGSLYEQLSSFSSLVK